MNPTAVRCRQKSLQMKSIKTSMAVSSNRAAVRVLRERNVLGREPGKGSMNKRRLGAVYEQAAAEFLREQGYSVLESNYRCRQGEIDLVAREGRYLVFVEVKYRKNSRFGEGEYAVDARKQKRISQAARWYLVVHKMPEDTACRFDVVAIAGQDITLIRDAFEFAGTAGLY